MVEGALTEFELPTPAAFPSGIALGSDGNVWFAEARGNQIGRITPGGEITEFPLPHGGSSPAGITSGPDGALWFAERNGDRIGRIATDGPIEEFPLPHESSGAIHIIVGPDGRLWFTEFKGPFVESRYLGNRLGQITVSGEITEVALPETETGPLGIVAGPDDAIWYTKPWENRIGRMTADGTTVDEFLLGSPRRGPGNLAVGPDLAIWFTGAFSDSIGRVDPVGRDVSEFAIQTKGAFVDEIALGPDGDLWFTERFGNKVGRISTDGTVLEFPIPTRTEPSDLNPSGSSGPVAITRGPGSGRTIWFTEIFAGRIGRVDVDRL